jgi:hypothetical protein
VIGRTSVRGKTCSGDLSGEIAHRHGRSRAEHDGRWHDLATFGTVSPTTSARLSSARAASTSRGLSLASATPSPRL